MGGSCDADSREKFSEFFRVTLSGKTDEHPIPATVGKWECPMDEKDLVYDYFYEVLCNYVIHRCFTFVSISKSYCNLLNSLKEKAAGCTGMIPSRMSAWGTKTPKCKRSLFPP